MKSLGISISRDALAAAVWDQTLYAARVERVVSVPCEEPFGGAADIARLAEGLRDGASGAPLPPAVLSLPPSWTFLRRVTLPVSDLPRAKKMHVADLEGNLPVEDDEILSDVLPSPPGEAGTFLAIAARRSAVEKTVAAFSEAGFRLDRVITDHVSLLLALASGKTPFSGLVLSRLNDLTVLRVETGNLAWARQFPAEMIDPSGQPPPELRELLAPGDVGEPAPVLVFGEIPAFLAGRPSVTAYVPPAGLEDASPIAYGAALAPFFKEIGGFSLRTSVETELERARGRSRFRIAAAAAVVALLSAAGSVAVAQWAERTKVVRVQAQIRKEFTQIVPGAKVVREETAQAQVREKLQSLTRQVKEMGADFPPAPEMLGTASRALPTDGNISVREASFDAGRLRLAGDAAAPALVESYRSALAQAFGAGTAVSIQESEGSARGGTVKFTILVERGANGRAS